MDDLEQQAWRKVTEQLLAVLQPILDQVGQVLAIAFARGLEEGKRITLERTRSMHKPGQQ
jgi:hypothetical protein